MPDPDAHAVPAPVPDWTEVAIGLAETIRRHYARFQEDVEQMRGLVEDAIGKLVAAYHILQAQAKIGCEVLRAQRRNAEPGEAPDETAVTQAGTSAALTALQFEDVLTQLLQRLRQRCDRFRPLPVKLVEGMLKTVETLADDPHSRVALEQVKRELCRVRADADGSPDRHIEQRSMEPGTVDLF